jgi:hypothetical protein
MPDVDSINSLNRNVNQIQSNLLAQQNNVNNIVTNENSRLNYRKQSIDNAYSTQKRAVYLNDNLQKQYNAFNKILVVVLIGAAVLLILGLLEPYLTFLPPFFIPIKYITIFSTVIIYSLVIYFDIQKHDPLNYDKLYLRHMTSNTSISGDDMSYNDTTTTDFSHNASCNNEACCTIGTVWDPINGNCVIEGFDNISPAGDFEFVDYSKY